MKCMLTGIKFLHTKLFGLELPSNSNQQKSVDAFYKKTHSYFPEYGDHTPGLLYYDSTKGNLFCIDSSGQVNLKPKQYGTVQFDLRKLGRSLILCSKSATS